MLWLLFFVLVISNTHGIISIPFPLNGMVWQNDGFHFVDVSRDTTSIVWSFSPAYLDTLSTATDYGSGVVYLHHTSSLQDVGHLSGVDMSGNTVFSTRLSSSLLALAEDFEQGEMYGVLANFHVVQVTNGSFQDLCSIPNKIQWIEYGQAVVLSHHIYLLGYASRGAPQYLVQIDLTTCSSVSVPLKQTVVAIHRGTQGQLLGVLSDGGTLVQIHPNTGTVKTLAFPDLFSQGWMIPHLGTRSVMDSSGLSATMAGWTQWNGTQELVGFGTHSIPLIMPSHLCSLMVSPCSSGYGVKSDECVACSPGTHSVLGGSCAPCQRGLYAPSTGTIDCLRCPPGTFGATTGLAVCRTCPVPSRCPGGDDCIRGWTGAMCVQCQHHFYDLFGQCVECPKIPIGLVVLVIIFLWLVLVLRALHARGHTKRLRNFFARFRSILHLVQMTSIIMTLTSSQVSPIIMQMVNTLGIVNLNVVQIVPVQCYGIPWNWNASFWLRAGVTTLSIVLLAFPRLREFVQLHPLLGDLYGFWLLFSYTSTIGYAIRPFLCAKVDGESVLIANPDLKCDGTTYWVVFGMAILVLCVVGLGTPWILYWSRPNEGPGFIRQRLQSISSLLRRRFTSTAMEEQTLLDDCSEEEEEDSAGSLEEDLDDQVVLNDDDGPEEASDVDEEEVLVEYPEEVSKLFGDAIHGAYRWDVSSFEVVVLIRKALTFILGVIVDAISTRAIAMGCVSLAYVVVIAVVKPFRPRMRKMRWVGMVNVHQVAEMVGASGVFVVCLVVFFQTLEWVTRLEASVLCIVCVVLCVVMMIWITWETLM